MTQRLKKAILLLTTMATTTTAADEIKAQVLDCNQQLLNAIAVNDYATYSSFVDPTVTCFEPEALGHLVEGLPFHEYYFNLSPPADAAMKKLKQNTMVRPHVRLLGQDTVAIVCYTRLTQRYDPNNASAGPQTIPCEETRIWERQADGTTWKNVHMHRSNPAK